MLRSIVTVSLRFRGATVALACLLLAYGVYVAAHAKLDVFPDFVQPQVEIQTECPGLSPEQAEQLVTRPVETAVTGLGNQESVRSMNDSRRGQQTPLDIWKHCRHPRIHRERLHIIRD